MKYLKPKTKLPSLSNEGRILLKEASLDPHGIIVYVRHSHGTEIQTNNKNLISSNERREVARWEAALKELLNEELLVARGQRGEVSEVTNLGYQIADMIQL